MHATQPWRHLPPAVTFSNSVRVVGARLYGLRYLPHMMPSPGPVLRRLTWGLQPCVLVAAEKAPLTLGVLRCAAHPSFGM